jgi:hypothetical protein
MVMSLRRWLALTSAGLVAVSAWHTRGAGVPPEPLPGGSSTGLASPTPAPAVRAAAVQGAGSCAATACHGSIAPAAREVYPSRVLRNEHTTWISQDPHAGAFAVLSSRRSDDMATRLNGGKATRATEEARCLACHATGGTGPAAVPLAVVREDGVSCEACHGAAEHWLGPHTQAGWAALPPAQKLAQFGMRPTRDLSQRAAICVECHVGSPGRDVNHDLIAAGHPRLSFEFAAFLANMPPHWVEDTGGNFPAQAWAVGQAATARAAADLLVERARKASHDRTAPWPEFSEYDCFACHHDLADEAWRRGSAARGSSAGTPTWGSWYFASLSGLAGPGDVDTRLADVRKEMGRFGSDAERVASAAQALSGALVRQLPVLARESRGYDAAKIKALIASAEAAEPGGPRGWDAAAQRYLQLQPLDLALRGLDPSWRDPRLEAELQGLFKSLQFPRGYDSPLRYDPASSAGTR